MRWLESGPALDAHQRRRAEWLEDEHIERLYPELPPRSAEPFAVVEDDPWVGMTSEQIIRHFGGLLAEINLASDGTATVASTRRPERWEP